MSEEKLKNLTEVILETRKANKETQEAMAKKLTISQSFQAEVENGIKNPSSKYLINFKNIYGVNLLNYNITLSEKRENGLEVNRKATKERGIKK